MKIKIKNSINETIKNRLFIAAIFLMSLFLSHQSYGMIKNKLNALNSLPKMEHLKKCFEECWGIDSRTAAFLCQYFEPSLKEQKGFSLVDDFVSKSTKLNIQFPLNKSLITLPADDGVIVANKFHTIVFESPYVRILVGRAE